MQIARIKHRFMIISVKMFIKKDLRCKSFSQLILQMRERYVSRINIRFRISSYFAINYCICAIYFIFLFHIVYLSLSRFTIYIH